MSFQVRITDAASAEVNEAAAWWAEHRSLEQALRWLREIHEHIGTLGDGPERRSLARESSRFAFEVRESRFGVGRRVTHRVLFRIAGDVVEVLAVRHVAQRPLRRGEL